MTRDRIRLGFLAMLLLGVSSAAHAGASCLLFPLSCLAPSKKYGEEMEATVISVDTDRITASAWAVPNIGGGSTVANPLENTREYFVAFQVGMTRYVAWRKDTVVQMMAGYTPRREEWVGQKVKMRFVDSSWMGIKGPGVVFKTPKKGKEWDLVVVDIIGPDGVDECKPYFGLEMNLGHCEPQAKVDRAAREKEILAALKAQGIDTPIWEVQDATLARAIYRQRSGLAARQGAPGYGRWDVTHDKAAATAVAHPDGHDASAGAGSAAAPADAAGVPTDGAAAGGEPGAAAPAAEAPPAADAAPAATSAPAADVPSSPASPPAADTPSAAPPSAELPSAEPTPPSAFV